MWVPAGLPGDAAVRDAALEHVQFGMSILIDCHSMPGNVHLPGSGHRPDFIIGDRYGTSAAAELSRVAVELLEQLGYAVARNKPYAGGFITEHYGRPTRGLHTLQIEINRSLYVDEATLIKKPGFAALEADLATFIAALARHVHLAEPQRLANRFGFLDISADRPERRIGRAVGGAGAELIEGDDAIALVDEARMALAQIVTGESRPAIQAEQGLRARTEAVGHHLVAIDFDFVSRLRLDITPH